MKEKLLLSKLFPAFLCFRPPVPPCPVQSRYCLLSAALSPTDWRLADSWARLRPRTTLSLTRSHLSSPPTSRLPLLTALCQLGRLSSLHMTHHVTSLAITGESQVTAQCSVFTKTISVSHQLHDTGGCSQTLSSLVIFSTALLPIFLLIHLYCPLLSVSQIVNIFITTIIFAPVICHLVSIYRIIADASRYVLFNYSFHHQRLRYNTVNYKQVLYVFTIFRAILLDLKHNASSD